MATAIGDLVARMRMDDSGFRRGAKGSIGTMGRMRASAAQTAGAFRALGGSLLAVAGIGGIGYMIKQQFDLLDALAKTSRQLGIQSGELVGLRHAAELSGAGADSMDAGLQTFAKRLGEATRGSGAAQAALAELGLDADRLAAKSLGDAFKDVAGAMEKFESPAKRNALAANLFSKANQRLLLTLDLGADGLQAMTDEADDLFGSMDTSRIEEANDAFTRMKLSMSGMFASAAVDLAPFVESIANLTYNTNEATDALGNATDQVGLFGQAADALLDAPVHLARLWSGIAVEIHNAWAAMTGMSADAWELAASAPVLGKQFERVAQIARDMAGESAVAAGQREVAHYEELSRGTPSEVARELANTRAAADKLLRDNQGFGGAAEGDTPGFMDALPSRLTDGMAGGGLGVGFNMALEEGLKLGMAGASGGVGTGGGGPKFAGAMERGSAEAYSTIVQAGKGGEKVGKEQLAVQKELLAVNRKILSKQSPQTVSIPV